MSKRLKTAERLTGPGGQDWQIQTAKARFSEVFRRARLEGPQRITRQGQEGVVMISDEQYARLMGKAHQPKSIVQFFRESPLVGVDLDLTRNKEASRWSPMINGGSVSRASERNLL